MKDVDRVRAEYEAKLNDVAFLTNRLEVLTGNYVNFVSPVAEVSRVDEGVLNALAEPDPVTKPKRSHHKGSN